jgi:hypothetical protein
MIMFTSLVQASWETVILSVTHSSSNLSTIYADTPFRASTPGLINGGLAGLFWGYIWTFIGFFTIVLSLAEMASM